MRVARVVSVTIYLPNGHMAHYTTDKNKKYGSATICNDIKIDEDYVLIDNGKDMITYAKMPYQSKQVMEDYL